MKSINYVRYCMNMPVNHELVREIAERIDDGRRVHLGILSRELNVPREDLRAAYSELSRQRGGDPLLDRARSHYAALRRMARR
ncbi:MAG: hypothetical protein ITG02_09865 [Patulibacter sp.]|nr:hypothetical protein [Patulibacter sp.]